MLLERGITSFFNWDDRSTIPEFTFPEFKCAIFAVASCLHLSVSELAECGITPNFHSARLDGSGISLTVLGHSAYPIIAFAEPFQRHECKLHFVNCTQIATEMKRLFPYLTVAVAEDLNRKPTESDFEPLNSVELDQINYWNPQSIGEIAFNWWD